MPVRRRPWTPPTQVETKRALALWQADQVLVTAKGRWSNCDAYIVCPDAWGDVNNCTVRVYLVEGQARSLMVTVPLWLAPYTQHGDGRRTYLVASLRGHPCDGFEVTAYAPRPVNLPAAYHYIEAWGTESTPEVVAGDPVNGVALQQGAALLPRRMTFNMVQSSPGVWVPMAGTASGIALVSPMGVASANSGGRVDMVNIGSGANYLQWFQALNSDAVMRVVQIFASDAVNPGDAPALQYPCPPQTTAGLQLAMVQHSFPGRGYSFPLGVTIGLSTTWDTWSSAGAKGWFAWSCEGA